MRTYVSAVVRALSSMVGNAALFAWAQEERAFRFQKLLPSFAVAIPHTPVEVHAQCLRIAEHPPTLRACEVTAWWLRTGAVVTVSVQVYIQHLPAGQLKPAVLAVHDGVHSILGHHLLKQPLQQLEPRIERVGNAL